MDLIYSFIKHEAVKAIKGEHISMGEIAGIKKSIDLMGNNNGTIELEDLVGVAEHGIDHIEHILSSICDLF